MQTSNRFITGIYNYCDYWCERCPFTRRCRNFAMGTELEKQAEDKPAPDDAANAEFWQHIAEKVRETTLFSRNESWEDDIEEDGIDFEIDPEWLEQEDARQRSVREHPLHVEAFAYMQRVIDWLKAADTDLKALAHELVEAAGNRFHDDDYEEQARQIGDLIDVVAWYHTLIPPKLGRALNGLLERDDADGPAAEILAESRQSDADGSGKVALIAIERSIGAWIGLRGILPAQEDAILDMLAMLSRLQRGIHAVLPGAATFQRPGFDIDPDDDE